MLLNVTWMQSMFIVHQITSYTIRTLLLMADVILKKYAFLVKDQFYDQTNVSLHERQFVQKEEMLQV